MLTVENLILVHLRRGSVSGAIRRVELGAVAGWRVLSYHWTVDCGEPCELRGYITLLTLNCHSRLCCWDHSAPTLYNTYFGFLYSPSNGS